MHIITLGTTQLGGIDSVIKGYEQDGLYDDVNYTRISSHTGESKLKDLLVFIRAFFSVIFILIKDKKVILHCHMSFNGSFWRKLVFMWLAKIFRARSIIHLHGSEFNELVVTILSYAGVVIKQADVTQFAGAKEVQFSQTEQ